MSKKILSVALALIFVISTFAVSAFAVGGTAFEEDASYEQTWRLEKISEADGTYTVGVYLTTNYKVGAIQFQIANEDGNAVLGGVTSDVFVDGDYDVQYTESGLVFIVPTPTEDSAEAMDLSTETLIATLSYTLAEGASSATIAIADDAKSESNPGGSLIAVRMSDDNLTTGTMIYGQTVVSTGDEVVLGSAAAADLALTTAGSTAGVVIDSNKTLGGAYAGVVYGFALPDNGVAASLTEAYYKENLTATNGGTIAVTKTPYVSRPASYGTGTTITVYNADGTSTGKTYVVIIFGDVTGDSKINNSDISGILAITKENDTYADSVKRLAANIAVAARGMSALNHYKVDATDLSAGLIAVKNGDGKFVNGTKAVTQADLAASHNTYNEYYQ